MKSLTHGTQNYRHLSQQKRNQKTIKLYMYLLTRMCTSVNRPCQQKYTKL